MTDADIIVAGAPYTRPKCAFVRIWKHINIQLENDATFLPSLAIEKSFKGMEPADIADILERVAPLIPDVPVEVKNQGDSLMRELCISVWLHVLNEYSVVALQPHDGWTFDESQAVTLLRALADQELQHHIRENRKEG